MFVSGTPLHSAYRVVSGDGGIFWFQCDAKIICKKDGTPWFIHGAGFDITELKRTEEALENERNVARPSCMPSVPWLWSSIRKAG